jgi:hypothetical protein
MGFTNLAAETLYDQKQFKHDMPGRSVDVSFGADSGHTEFAYSAIRSALPGQQANEILAQ